MKCKFTADVVTEHDFSFENLKELCARLGIQMIETGVTVGGGWPEYKFESENINDLVLVAKIFFDNGDDILIEECN